MVSQDSHPRFPQDFPGLPLSLTRDAWAPWAPDSLLVGAVPVHRMPVSQRPPGPLGQQRQQRHGHKQQQQQQRSRRHPRSRRRRRPPTEPRAPGFLLSQLPAAAAAAGPRALGHAPSPSLRPPGRAPEAPPLARSRQAPPRSGPERARCAWEVRTVLSPSGTTGALLTPHS